MTRYFVLYLGWTLYFIPTVCSSGPFLPGDSEASGLWATQAAGFVHQHPGVSTIRDAGSVTLSTHGRSPCRSRAQPAIASAAGTQNAGSTSAGTRKEMSTCSPPISAKDRSGKFVTTRSRLLKG